MRISPDMLRRGLLEQGVSVTVFGNAGGALNLSLVLFTAADGIFEDGAVYLIDCLESFAGAEKPGRRAQRDRKVRSVGVVAGKYDASLARRFETVFVADGGTPLFELHNKIQRVFEKYGQWSEGLRRLLNIGANVQEMIDAGTQAIEAPLILQDSNFSVIAVSSAYAGNLSLEPLLDRNNIPYMMTSERGAPVDDEETAGVVPLHIKGRRALYTNIFQQGRFQYRLLALETDQGFHESVRTLLEFLSGYIRLAIGFVSDEENESSALSFVMKGILSGEYRDESSIERRLAEYGWSPAHALFCAKICAELPDFRSRALRFISDRLSGIFPEACIFEYENNIAAFFNLSFAAAVPAGRGAQKAETPGAQQGSAEDAESAVRNTLSDVVKQLTGFLQDNNMKAGISNSFSGFGFLRQYYTQAGIASDFGPRAKPYQWLHRFGDVKENYILECCTRELPASMICDPGILRLRAYDETHKQDLYHTLYVYLKNNMRAVSAAKELFIHRSTFLYRLDRIREITGLSLENDSELWYLLLSYKLLEL